MAAGVIILKESKMYLCWVRLNDSLKNLVLEVSRLLSGREHYTRKICLKKIMAGQPSKVERYTGSRIVTPVNCGFFEISVFGVR